MELGIIEYFEMHNTRIGFGLKADGGRLGLISTAHELGFDGVEFGLGADYADDPLWTGSGNTREEISETCKRLGIGSYSVCLHGLNSETTSPGSLSGDARKTAALIIRNTIEACSQIGATGILMPFFGSAKLREEEQVEYLIAEMRDISSFAEDHEVRLCLETSLPAVEVVDIVDEIESPSVQVYYDIGNAHHLNHDAVKEIYELGSRISQVHIKDYPDGILGEGRVDFPLIFKALKDVGFKGRAVLEPTSTDNPILAAGMNLRFLQEILREYMP